MLASTFLSSLTSSTSQPLLPISSTPSLAAPFTDLSQPAPSDTTATLLALARQEAHLQSHIQYLLDVQSDRLLEGLGGDSAAAPPKPRSPNGVNGHDHDSPNRRREAGKEKPTLQGARKQIRTAISDLHSLKLQTADLVTADLSTTTNELNHINTIRTKKSKLESTIRELEASPASKELEALASEEEDLGRKIYEVENQLFEMKARQRVVRQRLEEGKNREEARVSSYKGSLEILGREERGVLERKPPLTGKGVRGGKGKGNGGGDSREGGGEQGDSVWDLPPKRRTLSMVGEYYESEKEALRKRLEGASVESRALEEGGRVWDEVVREVGNVERMLENEMMGLDHLDGDGGKNHEDKSVDGMRRVLEGMAQTRGKVGEKLKMAEEKGWNLLVVCVGAELEALVEGEEILKGVLGVGDGEGASVGHGEGVRNGDGREGTAGGKGLEDVRDLDMDGGKGVVEDTDADDEPGPELLLSTFDD
ncbi:MAG: hypothetical protein Q9213_007702 [Squamulea squamosa]